MDSLGFESELHALRVGHDEPGHWLADLASEVIENFGVQVSWIAGGEDSFAFRQFGIPSLGLGQKPTLDSSVKIHTPEDSLENLHVGPVKKGFEILMEILVNW